MNQHHSNPQHDDSLGSDQSLSGLASVKGAGAYRMLFGVDIESDRVRYRDISRGKIRDDLGKYMSQDEIIAQKGKDIIKIPLPRIDNPHFQTHAGDENGVGQGEGEPGDSIGRGDPQNGQGKPGGEKGDGKGEGAGEGAGNHAYEEVTLDELADMMGEKLQLPRIEPKGNKTIPSEHGRYNTISRSGRRASVTQDEPLRKPSSALSPAATTIPIIRVLSPNDKIFDSRISAPIQSLNSTPASSTLWTYPRRWILAKKISPERYRSG